MTRQYWDDIIPMRLIHLGYEDKDDSIAHGWHLDQTVALCHVRLNKAYTVILFATPGGYESDGEPYKAFAHVEKLYGRSRCKACLWNVALLTGEDIYQGAL